MIERLLGLYTRQSAGAPPLPADFGALRRRLNRLKMIVPAGLVIAVVLYELGPASWLYSNFGISVHMVAEIVVFGTVGPFLAYVLLDVAAHWLEERETSELQAQALAEARANVQVSRKLSDDAIQTLFAASTVLHTLKSNGADLPPALDAEVDAAEHALDQAIRDLRAHLLEPR